ncbi:MAG: helix-turn-helix transcriptional regulator [Bacteroidales bacterium]|nr:helix-turn-helix transcriptional regulator [Bacteroidales bacterium]
MNITDKIHVLRKEKGWSVAKLARVCGIPTVSLRAMLSRDNPNSYNVKTLIKLSKALGVSVSYLTLDDEETLRTKLTTHQKSELLGKFEGLLGDYFDIEAAISSEEQ